MPEKPSQYGSIEEIEQDVFLLAELNYRDAYAQHPFKALKEWYEFTAECRARGMTNAEMTEISWFAQERADTFNFDQELTNVE